ncbi:hypothetical protein H7849_09020 [Alloacidobacterium dinghuense]|uniref:Uncharacterized protein n=1 Tax=Alloacidobacterium dinghuense TaxID=2763107 RepID=A0A7G8BNA2_9BACT|nr:hypothetical protein [Alloacidobacterium dinghuense]QNI34022.1 hypothetical protein H7849_09020 [Alloacidobacterium dinghuense]
MPVNLVEKPGSSVHFSLQEMQISSIRFFIAASVPEDCISSRAVQIWGDFLGDFSSRMSSGVSERLKTVQDVLMGSNDTLWC